MTRAVLLDLDNTIIAYDAVAEKCWHDICLQFASQIDGLEANELSTAITEIRTWYWDDPERSKKMRVNLVAARREVVAIAFSQLGINDPVLANEIADAYSVEREKAAFISPSVIDTLNHFRNQGYRLALVTNGGADAQREKIERFGLTPYFDYILIEGEFGAGKPEESVFLHTLEKLGAAPQESWMIGDNLEHDVGGAQRVGIFGIWVDWRGTGLPASTSVQPDKIINKLSDLLIDRYIAV